MGITKLYLEVYRAGSKPSDIIDIFGTVNDNPNLRYARIHIESGKN